MAAHVITAMSEITQAQTKEQFEMALHGIGYAAFGNQLSLSQFSVLTAIFTLGMIAGNEKLANQALRDFWYGDYDNSPYQTLLKEYAALDYPETYEMWMARKYR